MEDHGIAEIEKAAHDYADARDARMAHGEEEGRRHTKLVAVMSKHGKKTYAHRTGDEVITVKVAAKDATAKAKVKIVPADDYKPESDAKTRKVADEQDIDLDVGGEAGVE